MKFLFVFILVFLAGAVYAQPKDTRYFELRTYYAAPGKLDALIKRFNDHTTKIFEKHGMTNIGYWVPVKNDQNAICYILAYKDKDARQKAWEAFGADPNWKKVKEESEKNGKLVDSVKSVFMTDSGLLAGINGVSKGPDRIFELRTYYCLPGRLPALITRFKDHTLKIFENNGMQNIAYFVDEQGHLVYLLAHKSEEAAKKSWDAFLVDPEWIKARDNSEKDGKILEKLESVYLKPLPFSAIK